METNTRKRYEKVKGQAGIRRDTKTGKLLVCKKIKGTPFYATFDHLMDAKHWKNTFLPPEEKAISLKMTLGELKVNYIRDHLANLASSTKGVRLDRLKIFDELHNHKVEELTPEIINRFFMKKTQEARDSKSRRKNFDGEIKDIRAMLNWYREVYNYKYAVPVITKRLKSICTISREKRVKEKLSAEEFIQFWNQLSPDYQDIALIQSRIAGRICEAAGLQFKCIDFEKRILTVKYVVVYGRKKEFVELKPFPKEEDVRYCHITDDMLEVLKRRLKLKQPNSDYVFHISEQPIKYRSVQHSYDYALKKAGLYGKTSGTHMLRHFTATLTRLVCGNLDAVQAVTGHKSIKLVQHYGTLSSTLQGDSITKVEQFLKQKSVELTSGEQRVSKSSS